ncbi:hypothetical protein [Oribacterium sp. C9]|nr:hypothetical protein [Oribacterium sp. C9]
MEDLIMNSFLVVTVMFLLSYIAKGLSYVCGGHIPFFRKKDISSGK